MAVYGKFLSLELRFCNTYLYGRCFPILSCSGLSCIDIVLSSQKSGEGVFVFFSRESEMAFFDVAFLFYLQVLCIVPINFCFYWEKKNLLSKIEKVLVMAEFFVRAQIDDLRKPEPCD